MEANPKLMAMHHVTDMEVMECRCAAYAQPLGGGLAWSPCLLSSRDEGERDEVVRWAAEFDRKLRARQARKRRRQPSPGRIALAPGACLWYSAPAMGASEPLQGGDVVVWGAEQYGGWDMAQPDTERTAYVTVPQDASDHVEDDAALADEDFAAKLERVIAQCEAINAEQAEGNPFLTL